MKPRNEKIHFTNKHRYLLYYIKLFIHSILDYNKERK